MTRRDIHRRFVMLTGGHPRIFWMCHGQSMTLAAALSFLVVALGLVGKWDMEDAIALERVERERLSTRLVQERAARDLDPVIFVVEARTPAEAAKRFSEISLSADEKSHQLRWRK